MSVVPVNVLKERVGKVPPRCFSAILSSLPGSILHPLPAGPSLYTVSANDSAVWSTCPGGEHLPWFSGFRKEADWVLVSIGLLRGVIPFSFPSPYLSFRSGLANISESGAHGCARELEFSTSGKLMQLPARPSAPVLSGTRVGPEVSCYPGCSQPVGFSVSSLHLGRY